MKKAQLLLLIITPFFALSMIAPIPATAQRPESRGRSFSEGRPYGDYCPARQGRYGATRQVESEAAARNILNRYYRDRDVSIASVEERRRFYRAEILDSTGNLLDIVIIDKRTGRIRSIY